MKTVEDVRLFFIELVDKYSLNFHPDTPFDEFEVLTKTQIKTLTRKMDMAFEICEGEPVDIYGIGLKVHRAALAKIRRQVKKQMHSHEAALEHKPNQAQSELYVSR